jgi:Metallopeptidase family M24
MQASQGESLMTAGDKPVVAVNEHSSIPHYAPNAEHSATIRDGDFVLLDIWAKENSPDGVFYDITWNGCVGQPSKRQREIFAIVEDARDLGVATVRSAISSGRKSPAGKLTASCAIHHWPWLWRAVYSPNWPLNWRHYSPKRRQPGRL